MAGTNNFLAFGTNTGANVIDQVTYSGLTARINGFTAGTAESPKLNKVWRQSSVIAAAIGQYIADQGYDALDNGDTATLLANLKKAFAVQIDAQSGNFVIDTGAANAYVVAIDPPITAYPDGMTLRFRASNANTGASTLNAGAGAVPLRNNVDSVLVAGDIPALSLVTVTYIASLGHFVVNTMVPSQNTNSGNGSVRGGRSNLAISYTGTSGAVTAFVIEVTVESSTGQYVTLKNLNLSANSGGASGAANSLDTGSWAFSTFYHLFVIYNPTTSTAALLWSLSSTAPTLPTGYTHFARIGANKTQSATNYWFLGGLQIDRKFRYKVAAGSNVTALPIPISGVQGSISAPTWVAASLAAYVPGTAGGVSGFLFVNSATGVVAPNASYGAYTSTTNPPPVAFSASASSAIIPFDFLLESTNIYYCASGSSCGVSLLGWEDNL